MAVDVDIDVGVLKSEIFRVMADAASRLEQEEVQRREVRWVHSKAMTASAVTKIPAESAASDSTATPR